MLTFFNLLHVTHSPKLDPIDSKSSYHSLTEVGLIFSLAPGGTRELGRT